MHVHDMSYEGKTVENLLQLIHNIKANLEAEWKVIIVMITSNCSREAKKAHHVSVIKDPRLVGPDFYGHQVCPFLI